MRIQFVLISVPVVLAATLLPGTASAQLHSDETEVQKLYPRAHTFGPRDLGLGKPAQLDVGERLQRIQCASSAMCAWRRIPAAGEHFWRGGSRSRRAPRQP